MLVQEGGAAVFNLQYNGQPAVLAQSPQLHKQMAVCGGLEQVFEIGPVERKKIDTTQDPCEFINYYFEVCDIIEGLFISMFKHLNDNCKKELVVINRQYPFEPLEISKRACNHHQGKRLE